MPPPRQPKEAPKPHPPSGSFPAVVLFTTCTLCALFLLWRRAHGLRTVVSHQLKTWTGHDEGRIQLAEDDHSPTHLHYLAVQSTGEGERHDVRNDDDDEDEPLALRVEHVQTSVSSSSNMEPRHILDLSPSKPCPS